MRNTVYFLVCVVKPDNQVYFCYSCFQKENTEWIPQNERFLSYVTKLQSSDDFSSTCCKCSWSRFPRIT